MVIYCGGSTKASRYAVTYLQSAGMEISEGPSKNATHLLLDVPSFGPNGQLRGGGDFGKLLAMLPGDVTVCGGNLNHPALAGYRTVDLLQDAVYLAENAYITAECALDVALPYLTVTLRGCPVLILGWGRIGKCLGQLLKAIGSDVTIAARKESDRALIRALGYQAVDTAALSGHLHRYRLIYNTAPTTVLDRAQMTLCREDCVRIDLASKPGIEDDDAVIARGLPGIHLPESSGKLIADTLIRLNKEEKR